MASKKEEVGWFIPLAIILIFATGFIPAAIATYLYYRSYKTLPDFEGKKRALFSAVISCIPLYITGIVFLVALYNKFTGNAHAFVDFWEICVPLIALITIPAWLDYLHKIKKLKGMHEYATSYFTELNSILKDKKFDDEEIERLKNLIIKYRISEEYLDVIHRQAFFSALFNCVTNDFEINSSEQELLKKIKDNFNLDQDTIDAADLIIERTKTIKNIIEGREQGIITTVFMPQKNERCIILEDCTLYEDVKKGLYTGGSLGLKNLVPFGKLLNPRFYAGTKINYERFEKIDSGKLALSTKRIVFIGDKITRSINFDDIIGLDTGRDGFQINRQGKVKKEAFKMDEYTVKLFIGALLYLKGEPNSKEGE